MLMLFVYFYNIYLELINYCLLLLLLLQYLLFKFIVLLLVYNFYENDFLNLFIFFCYLFAVFVFTPQVLFPFIFDFYFFIVWSL